LEHQGNEIAGNEDPGVVTSWDLASILAEGEDNVFESQVDACCDESWGEDEAGDLDFEPEG
jgi:hypothetical protein